MSSSRWQSRYRVERISSESGLRQLRSPWTALMGQAAGAPIFLTWEWVDAWWRNRDVDGELYILAARDDQDSLVGLAPLMLVRERLGPIRLRRLAFIGTGLVYPVHLDIIAPPAAASDVCQAFEGYLRQRHGEWDVLDLSDVSDASPFNDCLSLANRRPRRMQPAIARFTALPESWEAYEKERMSKTNRGHMGQKRRKLEREHPGLVAFCTVRSPVDAASAFDAMTRLNQSRWHEKSIGSSFDSPAFVAFHREIVPLALERDWLRLHVLKVGDEYAAVVYGLLYQNVLYVYQTAFNAAWGKYSPGQLLITYTFQQAIAEGAHELNMLRGEQEYKLTWTDQVRYDSHLVLSDTLAGHLWSAGGSLYDHAKLLGREILPRRIQDRLNQLVSGRGVRHVASDARNVSD